MPPPTRKQRTLGALLGVHAGDSLGATLEFATWESIRARYPTGLRDIIGGGPFRWPAGHATDDTDMTRAVLLAYRVRLDGGADVTSTIIKDGSEDPSLEVARTAGRFMLNWLDGCWPGRVEGSRPRDMGAATGIGLERFRLSGDPENAGAGKGQAGNGSLMRCIPTALFQPDKDRMRRESVLISAITHNDSRCTTACAAYNAMVAALLEGKEAAEAVAEGLDTAASLEGTREGKSPVRDAIELGKRIKITDLAEQGPLPFLGKASGYVLESLTIAVAALLDLRSFEDVLVDVVRIGEDTDTNGAIAGGLLGARDGAEAIPRAWVEKLQFADAFTMTVNELTD